MYVYPQPEAMARVREEHSHLQAVLGTLNQKISGVLSKQDGDFIAAYRAHMYTVQKELQTLRYGFDWSNTDQIKVAFCSLNLLRVSSVRTVSV
jgi:hypothetical protein